MTDESIEALPLVELTSPGADASTANMLKLMNDITARHQKMQARAFDEWARQHVPRLVRDEMQRVSGLDVAERVKEWAAMDDERDRLVRVLECAKQLLTAYDVTIGRTGYARRLRDPHGVPDPWLALYSAVQAVGVVPPR